MSVHSDALVVIAASEKAAVAIDDPIPKRAASRHVWIFGAEEFKASPALEVSRLTSRLILPEHQLNVEDSHSDL